VAGKLLLLAGNMVGKFGRGCTRKNFQN